MVLGQGDHAQRTPSMHSDPDPGDEDCLPTRRPSHEVSTRPGMQNTRLPSYTNFMSRTFTPDAKPESRFGLYWTKSDSPTARAASEATSTNEDWKTALNTSPQGTGSDFSDVSRGLKPSSNDRHGSLNDKQDGLQARSHIGNNLQESPDESVESLLMRDRHRGETEDPGQHAPEEMRTPQARRKLSPIAQRSNNSTDIMNELADLRRRLHELEAFPKSTNNSPYSIRRSPRSVERTRPHTDEGFLDRSTSRQARSAAESSHAHTHPLLRASIGSIRNSNLSTDLVRPLDLAVSDALALSALPSDRLARSRVDGLCRSLTAVCLYLQNEENYNSLPRSSTQPTVYAHSDVYDRSHSRAHSIGSSVGITRSRSSRKSLAEILRTGHERSSSVAPSSVAGASDTSRLPRREYSSSLAGASVYAESAVNYPIRSTTSRNSVYAHSHMHDRHSDTASASLRKSGRRDDSAHRQSPTSRTTNGGTRSGTSDRPRSEILTRSPVTREALYARYYRDIPEQRQPGDSAH